MEPQDIPSGRHWRSRAALLVRYLYLLRVPLLTAIVFLGVLPANSGHALLRGMFDLRFGGLVLVGALATYLALAVWLASLIILLYGPRRFGLPKPEIGVVVRGPRLDPRELYDRWRQGLAAVAADLQRQWMSRGVVEWPAPAIARVPPPAPGPAETLPVRSLRVLAIALLLLLAFFGVQTVRHNSDPQLADGLAFLLGVFTTAVVAYAGHFFWKHELEGDQLLTELATRPYQASDTILRVVATLAVWAALGVVRLWARLSPAGFIRRGSLGAMHGLMTISTLLFGAVYAGLYSVGWNDATGQAAGGDLLATLAFVLVLGILVCHVLAGISFFADRFRIPVLLVVGLVLYARSWFPGADHVFPTFPAAGQERLTPRAVLEAGRPEEGVIVVCANGGGIQAAGWTARVLTALEEAEPGRFSSHVRLVSGVSGGSAGLLPFLHDYPPARDWKQAFARATTSSLGTVGWGLTGPDLLRTVIPWDAFGEVDRGWALEQSWWRQGIRGRVGGWREAARAGRLPGVLFNATIVENGASLAFANFDLARADAAFHQITGRDTKVTTAVRLSATFPLVTPAARAEASGFHVVDGGYYDNAGVAAALEVLREALLEGPPSRVRRVLFIQLRGFKVEAKAPSGKHESTAFQFLAPLETLAAVRGRAQLTRNETEIALFTAAAAARGIHFENLVVESPQRDVPLSWHLAPGEVSAIHTAWRGQSEPAVSAVRRFLAGQ